ncbi:MAG: endonuclease III [Dehalococcoidia bacterium]|nr:endonuclease III [Dehalococcoidia bacterium]
MTKLTTLILKSLKKEYSLKRNRPHGDGISELILTILSQNTADRNSGQAFAKLLSQFSNWDQVLQAEDKQIKQQIQIGGMSNTKSKTIKKVLRIVKEQNSNYNLSFLKKMKTSDALDWLINLPGVGSKTASCVLLFAYGIPFIPVDTHVERIAKRIGLVENKLNYTEVQNELESMMKKQEYGLFHLSFIEHGRKICNAKKPICSKCSINKLCKKNDVTNSI